MLDIFGPDISDTWWDIQVKCWEWTAKTLVVRYRFGGYANTWIS